jgi:hypothetical protein
MRVMVEYGSRRNRLTNAGSRVPEFIVVLVEQDQCSCGLAVALKSTMKIRNRLAEYQKGRVLTMNWEHA